MRYILLACVISATFTTSACGAQPAPAPEDPEQAALVSGRLMAPEKVTDHVWVMRQPDRVWSAVVGNVEIIEQSDGVVLVDSGGTIQDGRDVLAAVARLTSKPVKAVIVTHWHNDHPFGVPAIVAKYPKVRIIATETTARALADIEVHGTGIGKPNPERRDKRFKSAETRAADYRKSAADPSLSPEVRHEYATEAAWVLERAKRQLEGFVVLPTETFTDRLAIDDPVAPVEALYLGRGNTTGDAFAWLPKQKVMIAGDSVVAPTPYGFGTPTAPWLATYDKMGAYPFTVLIPGHGRVQRDRSYIATLRWSMADIERQAKALAATDPNPEAALKKFDRSEQRRRFGANDAWSQRWLDDYWIDGMFTGAFQRTKGTFKDDPYD